MFDYQYKIFNLSSRSSDEEQPLKVDRVLHDSSNVYVDPGVARWANPVLDLVHKSMDPQVLKSLGSPNIYMYNTEMSPGYPYRKGKYNEKYDFIPDIEHDMHIGFDPYHWIQSERPNSIFNTEFETRIKANSMLRRIYNRMLQLKILQERIPNPDIHNYYRRVAARELPHIIGEYIDRKQIQKQAQESVKNLTDYNLNLFNNPEHNLRKLMLAHLADRIASMHLQNSNYIENDNNLRNLWEHVVDDKY